MKVKVYQRLIKSKPLKEARAKIQMLVIALAESEALELSHGERIEKLTKQLAAEQAKNVGLREKVQKFIDSLEECTDFEGFTAYIATMDDYHEAVEALSTPSDTSALEAMIAKAGEGMRERCIEIADCSSIRALPAVTLEDLK